ncbi:MAG: glycoside hydrolase family 3 protein [Acidobacteria bacterium]|nr:glycoside hydrolase family 3 protein [Acidobacteriota bacterium]
MKDAGRLTLEEKVGQLFFLGFQGRTPEYETRAILDVIRPGGFVLLQRNIEGFDQIYDLNKHLRAFFPIEPFLAIDHEGGRVDRLKHLFAPMPSLAELARAGTAQVRSGAKIIAAELEAAGFNTNFAPVVDLELPGSVVSERTLGRNASDVGRLAAAFVDELAKRNIVGCAKHFPGLGGAKADTHFVLARVDRTKRELQQEDMLPFQRLVDEVGMIMVSHAHYPALGDDKPTPASLSPRIVDGTLRKKLGFGGVIVTDDLTMGAITSIGLTPELFLRAFEAGNDMLLFSQTTPLVEQAFKTIVRAARNSAALRNRLDESADRILKLKSQIEFSPLRYRAHLQSRITRQIEKLRGVVIEEVPS